MYNMVLLAAQILTTRVVSGVDDNFGSLSSEQKFKLQQIIFNFLQLLL